VNLSRTGAINSVCWAGAGVVLLVGLVTRFWGLGSNSLWLDEAIFANNAFVPFDQFLANTRMRNSAPIALPLAYHLLGHAVRDPFTVRLLPALFSVGSIAVLLCLPFAGVRKAEALGGASLLALAPKQILYAQEVREYSLGVLSSAIILFSLLYYLHRSSRRAAVFLLFALGSAPFLSYGPCFTSLSALAVLGLTTRAKGGSQHVHTLVVGIASFAASAASSYLFTARYQLGVMQQQYLAAAFPPGDLSGALAWLLKGIFHYTGVMVQPGPLAVMVLLLVGSTLVIRAWTERPSLKKLVRCHVPELLFTILFLGSIAAAFLRLYPFGGIRQHLFAAPILALVVSRSFFWTIDRVRSRLMRNLFLGAALFATAAAAARNLPESYAETEEVVAPVRNYVRVPDEAVYVHHGAVPAVVFHFPDRAFRYGSRLRGRPNEIAAEILVGAEACVQTLIFTHVFLGEDEEVLMLLTNGGVRIIEDVHDQEKTGGARIVAINVCSVRRAAADP
jgi:hypothetical protein